MSSKPMSGPAGTRATDGEEWLTAEQFAGIEGMPGTAKGARLRLEKLAMLHPEIRRKRTGGKGFHYHISAAGMTLKSERDAVDTSADEQLNLWIQLFRAMKPASRDKMLQQALAQVAQDLAERGEKP
ncbi:MULTISPECIES: hypothetical protein [Enterobacteriaceae]|uniref:hypothetical protein n=1 Tax=Enterobacteriaceae TaxID=543 RepID=UPI0009925DD2|nr:hypothetical protein [Enterobacter kobei]OOV68516.1 hypothetical protein B1742_25600 [Enterobacter kobei]